MSNTNDEYDSDYYIVFTELTCNESYATINTLGDDEEIIFTKHAIKPTKPLKFRVFGNELADIHPLGGAFVISEKIKHLIASFRINRISLHPATLIDQTDTLHTNYWYLHPYNYLACLNLNTTQYQERQWGKNPEDSYKNVRRFSLDTMMLDEISEEHRLIIPVGNNTLFQPLLFHKTIVKKMVAIHAKGFRFIPVHQYEKGMEAWANEELASARVDMIDLASRNDIL